MKIKELENKTAEELDVLIAQKRQEIRELRFAITLRQEGNVRKLRAAKRDLARLLMRQTALKKKA